MKTKQGWLQCGGLFAVLGLVAFLHGVSAKAETLDLRFSNTVAQMSAYITNQMAANGVSGLSIALVESNAIVWSQGFGTAVVESNVPATAQTVYRIGSVSKLLTTLSVLKLWEDREVDLEASITNYVSEFATLPRFSPNRPPTVRECLNHLSGLPGDMFRNTFATAPWDGYNTWLLGELATDYPNYPVGFRSIYCNTGFQLAEEVVARVSGLSLNNYAQAYFFGPLGMTSSSYLKDKPNIVANLAHTYAAGSPLPEEFANAYGTSGMYSSVEDIATLIRLILSNGSFNGANILATNTVAAMLTDQSTNIAMNVDSDFHCGLGWDTLADSKLNYAGRLCFKGGETFTYEAEVGILLDRQLGVVVMQNATGTLPSDVAHATLQQAVLDRDNLPQPTNFVFTATATTNWTPTAINAVTGTYITTEGMDSGFDFLTIAPDSSLTWTIRAHTLTPIVFTGLVPHVDGCFYNTDQPGVRILPTNIASHAILIFRNALPYSDTQQYRGELYAPSPISAAWSNRLNATWLPVDMPPTDLYWTYASHGSDLRLQLTNRLGMIWLTSPSGKFVISPSNDNLGFAAGSAVRRGASVVIAATNGAEYLRHSSYTYRREDTFPALVQGVATNGTLLANQISWFAFNAVAGACYNVTVSNQTADILLNLGWSGWSTNRAGWTCPADGQYWLALAAAAPTPFNLTLGAGTYSTAVRIYLQDTAGVVTTWALNNLGLLQQSSTVGDMGSWQLMAAGDVTGDGRADLFWESADHWVAAWWSTNGTYQGRVLGNLGSWVLRAVADVDGDGTPDLLWQNGIGDTVVWSMNSNGTIRAGTLLAHMGPWRLKAAADINHDGKADLFWQTQDGWVVVWVSSAAGYSGAVIGNLGAWELRAAIDVDGDGIPDLLWENPDGWTAVWYMTTNGTLRAGQPTGKISVNAKIMAAE